MRKGASQDRQLSKLPESGIFCCPHWSRDAPSLGRVGSEPQPPLFEKESNLAFVCISKLKYQTTLSFLHGSQSFYLRPSQHDTKNKRTAWKVSRKKVLQGPFNTLNSQRWWPTVAFLVLSWTEWKQANRAIRYHILLLKCQMLWLKHNYRKHTICEKKKTDLMYVLTSNYQCLKPNFKILCIDVWTSIYLLFSVF